MCDALANYQVILFVYGNTDSVTANPNFVFIRITGHTFNDIPIKRDWWSTALQTHYLQLELVFFWQFGKFF